MFTFFRVCFVLVILETNAEDHSTDNPVIVFHFSPGRSDNIIKYTVVKQKPLFIILKNFYPVSAKCSSYYAASHYTQFISKDFDDLDPDGTIYVQNITYEMSTKWKCTVLTGHTGGLVTVINGMNYSFFYVYFNIHVKGTEKVSFTVNGWSMEPNISEQPGSKYDGENVYEYSDGELILLDCETAIGSTWLKYYDAQGLLLFQTDKISSERSIFRSILTAHHNSFYMECEHDSTNPTETYSYRLKFVLTNQLPKYDDEINLSVNDLTLVPGISNLKRKRYYDYYYEYGFETTLNVTCQKKNNGSGHIGLEIKSNTILILADKVSSNIMQTKQSTLNLNNKTLICEYTNIDTSIISARLKLKSAVVGSATRILGLPEENLEYQYTKNKSFYSMNYRYSSNEKVQLSCVTNYDKTRTIVWNYENKSDTFEPEKNYTLFFGKSATLQFTFTAEYNATSIQCNILDKYGLKAYTVDVFLNLDPNSVVSVNLIADENQPLIIIGGSIAVMVVIITVICAICWCTRARKKTTEDNYENFSNNDSNPAYQSQWENNYEDPANVFPSLRQSGTPSEGHYTEIDYFFTSQLPTNTNIQSYTNYENVQRSNASEISCSINSTNSVAYRKISIDIKSRNSSGTNIAKVTFKNNSFYSSNDSEASRCVIINNDDYEQSKI